MKKIICALVLSLSFLTISAQGTFKVGLVGGVALQDAEPVSDFALGIDAYYMFNKKRAFLNLGPTIGYRNYFLKADGTEDASFLPIGAAARIRVLGISVGLDGGYAVGLTNSLDGGFYVRPLLAFSIFSIFELNFSYEAVYDDLTWANANIGFLIQI